MAIDEKAKRQDVDGGIVENELDGSAETDG